MIQGAGALYTGQQKYSADYGDSGECVTGIDPLVADKGKDNHTCAGHRTQDTLQYAKILGHLHGINPFLHYLLGSIVAFGAIIKSGRSLLKKYLRAADYRPSRHPCISCLLVGSMMMTASLHVSAMETRDEILQRIEVILSSSQLQESAIEKGKAHSVQCSQCHGHDGNSSYPWVPNLASQNPIYFIEQSLKFRQLKRKDHVMSEIIKLLSDQQLVELAVYYSSRSLKFQGNAGTAVIRRGEMLYRERCEGCHGKEGLGGNDKAYAWLAGQQTGYLIRTLKRFRDSSDLRHHQDMAAVTSNLTDSEIEGLAAYLSNLY